jgi:hypothetical protein
MIHKVIIPDSRLVNVSFTIPENYVGEQIEVVAFRKGEALVGQEPSAILSPALTGNPLSNKEFAAWIKDSENQPTTSLEEAKNRWENKKKQLRQLIR